MAEGQSFINNTTHKRRAEKARRYTKKSGVFATPAGFSLKAGDTRSSVLKAASIFQAQAKKNAARFSTRIPAATYVQGYQDQEAMVVTDGSAAPNAAPFEFGERHPLWGRWVTGKGKQPRRSYMSNAATNAGVIENAAEAYAEAERILLAEEFGFTE